MEKQNVLKMICEDFEESHRIAEDTKKHINYLGEETINYIKELLAQVASANPGPLITKTPKIKKRTIKIKPIREDSILETSELSLFDSAECNAKDTSLKENTQNTGRSSREASTRNADKSTNKTKSLNENGALESAETSLTEVSTSRNKT